MKMYIASFMVLVTGFVSVSQAAEQWSTPSVVIAAETEQDDLGCIVRAGLFNSAHVDIQDFAVRAEVFAGSNSLVLPFRWEFVDAGKTRTTTSTMYGHRCRPYMRLVIREVEVCRIGGRYSADCDGLVQPGVHQPSAGHTALPVEVRLPPPSP